MVRVDSKIIIPDSNRMSGLNPKATKFSYNEHSAINEVTGNAFVQGRQASLNKLRKAERKTAKKARQAAARNAAKHKTGKSSKSRKSRRN